MRAIYNQGCLLLFVYIYAGNILDTKGGRYVLANTMQKHFSIKAGCTDEGYRETFKVRIDFLKQIKLKVEVLLIVQRL